MSVNIQVAIRVRPFTVHDRLCVITSQSGDGTGEVNLINRDYTTKQFACNYSWWSADGYKRHCDERDLVQADSMKLIDQEAVYSEMGLKIKADLLSGRAVVLLPHGSSGSGKTYTLYGSDAVNAADAWFKHATPQPSWGIFPRLAYELFEMKETGWKIIMKYFQNVVDIVRDLMSPTEEEQHFKVGMRTDSNGFMDIEWCQFKEIGSWADLTETFQLANARKAIAPTQFNPFSTRGHCIMMLDLEMPNPGTLVKSRIYVCDLPGTEPAGDIVYATFEAHTLEDGSSEYSYMGPHPDKSKTKELQEQSKKINLSLTEMAQLFMKMAEAVRKKTLKPGKSIPGCNSYFLCKFLKNIILQSKTYLVGAIRPEVEFFNYTLGTLGFAKNAVCVSVSLVPPTGTTSAVPSTSTSTAKWKKNEEVKENERNEKQEDDGINQDIRAATLKGSKEWGRSKILLVGEGRAGKTAVANSIIGKQFTDTASTVGINQLTCDIKYASVGGASNQWGEFTKPAKEFEAALASMVADERRKAAEAAAKEAAKAEAAAEAAKATDAKHMPSSHHVVSSNRSNNSKSNSTSKPDSKLGASSNTHSEAPSSTSVDISAAAAGVTPSMSIVNVLSPQLTKPGDNDNDNDNDDEEEEDIPPSSMADSSQAIDEALVMKCLSSGIQTDSKLVISVFDYGGQSVFNVIHHLFLTKYGVYVLVFNMEWLVSSDVATRDRCLSYLNFWLNSVVIHTLNNRGETAPVVFVGTRKDIVSQPVAHQTISTLLYDTFHSNIAWPYILENENGIGINGHTALTFFPVDNKAGRGDPIVLELLNVIEKAMDASAYVHAKKPLSWLQALDKLTEVNKSYLRLHEVETIVKTCGVPKQQLPHLLRFLHEMGVLMWHEEEGLRDVVIFDALEYFVTPATVIICKHVPTAEDATHHLLEVHKACKKKYHKEWILMTDQGIVSSHLLFMLLREYADHAEQIVHLMIKFGLLAPLAVDDDLDFDSTAAPAATSSDISEANVNTGGAAVPLATGQYLVPALLPALPVLLSSSTDGVAGSGGGGGAMWGILDQNWTDQPNVSSCFLVFSAELELATFATVLPADLKSRGFLPRGLAERLIGKAVAWSQRTSVAVMRFEGEPLFQDFAILTFGRQRFRLRVFPDNNCIQLDVEGDSPLAILDRIISFVTRIISECMRSLNCFVALPFDTNTNSTAQIHLAAYNFLSQEGSMLLPLERLREVIHEHSALNRPGGRSLLSESEVRQLYSCWLLDYQLLEKYDCFISYRWNRYDSEYTTALFDLFSNYTVCETHRAVDVFLDNRRLQEGRSFQNDFSKALVNSIVVVPILSHHALLRMVDHDVTKEDNLLIEWLMALECFNSPQSRVSKILPIIFGDRDSTDDQKILSFFAADSCYQRIPSVVPTASIQRAKQFLQSNGLTPSANFDEYTVETIVTELSKFLSFLTWHAKSQNKVALEGVHRVMNVLRSCEEAIKEPLPHRSQVSQQQEEQKKKKHSISNAAVVSSVSVSSSIEKEKIRSLFDIAADLKAEMGMEDNADMSVGEVVEAALTGLLHPAKRAECDQLKSLKQKVHYVAEQVGIAIKEK